MTRNPDVECRVHARQPTVLVTVYDRRARPRDRPDRYVCAECVRAGAEHDATNSIRIAPEQ